MSGGGGVKKGYLFCIYWFVYATCGVCGQAMYMCSGSTPVRVCRPMVIVRRSMFGLCSSLPLLNVCGQVEILLSSLYSYYSLYL